MSGIHLNNHEKALLGIALASAGVIIILPAHAAKSAHLTSIRKQNLPR
jgi:hypothetical protein